MRISKRNMSQVLGQGGYDINRGLSCTCRMIYIEVIRVPNSFYPLTYDTPDATFNARHGDENDSKIRCRRKRINIYTWVFTFTP